MSDLDSDSDLAHEIYDPEDDPNYYGSPVRRSLPLEGPLTSTAQMPILSERTQFCQCKNTCSRKSGKKQRGCPCRDDALFCSEKCSCGTAKSACKNRLDVANKAAVSNAGLNAFERHRIAVEESKQEISEFISILTGEQKNVILLELLSNGSGSMDYAKKLLDFGGTVPELPPTKPCWCVCGICQPMTSEEENKCCGKITCVTSFVTFRNVCTDREVLIMAIRARCDIRADEIDYSMNSFRKAAYRQYILWRYKNLGVEIEEYGHHEWS